jgi:transcriptional regulator with XRE-family HTH domain
MKIGNNIKKIRKEQSLKRSDLVKKLRFTYGENALGYRTIQRIERGENLKDRLSSLLQLAYVLGVDLNQFYKGTEYEDKSQLEEAVKEICITKNKARGGTFRYNDKAVLEIVSPKNSGYMSMLMELEPNSKTKQEQDPEATIKFMFVIAGEITIVVEELERTLSKGDSVQINSHRPHHFENRSKKKSLAILYQNPKRF